MAKGTHKSDPLRENRTTLVTGDPWYSTTSKDYLSPSLTQGTEQRRERAPAASRRSPGRHRRTKPGARKIRSRYIFAATLTAGLAVPALWTAGWIATNNHDTSQVQMAGKQAWLPMTLYQDSGNRTPICVYIQNTSQGWKAWATDKPC
jgi:hypothetical protein